MTSRGVNEEGIGLRHLADLISEVELGDYLADVFAEAIEVVTELGFQLRGIAEQGLESEARGNVEDLPGGMPEAIGIEHRQFGVLLLEADFREHRVLGLLQQAINTPENEHRQDDIPVFSPHEHVPQAVVRNGPDKGDDFVMGGVVHALGKRYGCHR